MTRSVSAIERFFERLFERPAARLFRAPLQPIHLERRLERAMDAGRVASHDRRYVPNRYRVALHPADVSALAGYGRLEADLADALRARARQRGYRLVARPEVRLIAVDDVEEGDIRVTADPLDPSVVRAVADRDAGWSEEHRPASTGLRRVAVGPGKGATSPQPSDVAVNGHGHAVAAPSTSPFTSTAPERLDTGNRLPAAFVHIRSQGGVVRTFTFGGGSARIGRSSDNEIILVDDRVSRWHGQLTNRQGMLVYTDLGSTNGSFVNGTRVREIALGGGDVVRLGNSTLTIQPHS